MGVVASQGYGIPKPGVRGGWTASFGYGNYPFTTLLIKASSQTKNQLKTFIARDMSRSTVESKPMTASTTDSPMVAGTSGPVLSSTTSQPDLDRSTADGDMDYASREGTQETASEGHETQVSFTLSSDLTKETLDPAEKDEDDG